jgi:signal transduction histidine kinase
MPTTMRRSATTGIGPAPLSQPIDDDLYRGALTPEGHVHLILQADVALRGDGLPCLMRLLHILRRDVRAHVWDYAVAVAMVGFAVVVLVSRIDVEATDTYTIKPDTVWSWALTIGVCGALVGRRRWPLRSLAVGLVLIVPLELREQRDSVAFFALVIALYGVATYLPLRMAWRGVAMVAALYTALLALGSTTLRGGPQVGVILLATGFALGRMLRGGRLRQEREVEAAVARAAEAVEISDLLAADERLRMAQELHDVVAHSLSVIAVQAGIGVHLIDRQPAEAVRALDAIRTTSHTATSELSRLVDVLRDSSSVNDRSAPGLNDVTELTEHIRTANVPVALTTYGDLDIVPAGVSLAAYRIVQEALTNVVRHAGRAKATVTIRVTDDQVELCVDDDGRGAPPALDSQRRDCGHGLLGMTERAAMYGGEVRIGPRPGGGFRVQTTLRYFTDMNTVEAAKPMAEPSGRRGTATSRRRPAPWMWDIALAGLMVVLATIDLATPDPTTIAFTPTDGWAWLLNLSCCATLAVRRRYPTAAYVTGWVLGLILTVGDYRVGVVIFVFWIGLYTVAGYATTRRLVGASIGTFVGLAIIAWSRPPDLSKAGTVFLAVLFIVSAVAGYVARRDRERRTTDLAEREDAAERQSRQARLIIANERLRIADELSSIITRSIDSITRHAGTGSHLVGTDSIATRASLESISVISRDALNDLRRLLKRMRTETEPALYAPIVPTLAVVGDAP